MVAGNPCTKRASWSADALLLLLLIRGTRRTAGYREDKYRRQHSAALVGACLANSRGKTDNKRNKALFVNFH